MRVTDVMRSSFATVKPSTPLIEAARLLLETNQRGLPVLDKDGNLSASFRRETSSHRDELGVKPPPAIGWRSFWELRRAVPPASECVPFVLRPS